jgi:hypothetical protein
MEHPPNYNGENMLYGANKLNNDIKFFLNDEDTDISLPDYREVILEYKADIEEYIRDIGEYNFRMPNEYGLTKEGILIDLNTNLKRIDKLLSGTHGGKRRRKNKSKRKGKRGKTRRNKRRTNRKHYK